VGFVLNGRVLITLRYAEHRSFDVVAERFRAEDGPPDSIETFVALTP